MHHVISETETFGRRLLDRIETCSEAFIATAFFTKGAFDELRDAVRDALRRKAAMTFLLGRYDYVTDPAAVTALLRLARLPSARLRVLFDGDFYFHYKLALFRDEGRQVVILGSSNVTPKGLSSKGEDNVEIFGEKALYDRLKKDLWDRAETAYDAEKELAEYSRLYRKYKRLRVARNRANRAGARRSRKPTRQSTPRLDLSAMRRLVYCNIDDTVDDDKITQNAEREVRRARKSGLSFPNIWFQGARRDQRLYKPRERFLIANDINRIIGIASCTKVAEVLDGNSRRTYIVFYRYERRRKFKINKEESYLKFRSHLRAGNKDVLGPAAIRTAQEVLKRLSRQQWR
jgi:HKD family nuclease